MNKVNGRALRVERDWAAIIEAQARSQRTAAGFCREHGIRYGTFQYHRHKIHKTRGRGLAIGKSPGLVPVTRPGGFLPVRVEGSSGLRLRFPGGLVLESEGLPSAAWVVEIVRRWNGEASSC